jgi:hypothetical protein
VFGERALWNSLQGLLQMGIRGVTVSDVRGFGAQGGSTERYEGSSSAMVAALILMLILLNHCLWFAACSSLCIPSVAILNLFSLRYKKLLQPIYSYTGCNNILCYGM